jgi:hypothetical protein
MGGKSTQQQQAQTVSQPWQPAQGALGGILGGVSGVLDNGINPTGAETGAINQLESNAAGGNPYTGDINSLANSLFSGGTDRTGIPTDAYNSLIARLSPTANGDYTDPNKNPFFAQTTQTIGNDVMNRLNAEYAGAGRDPSGSGKFGYDVARGVAEGTAPVFANQYNAERTNQINAANNLFTGGAQTGGILSGLDQQALANRGAGVGAAQSALEAQNYGPTQTLAAELQRRGIPLGILSALAGITTPIAGLGGQTNSTSNTTKQMSGAEQFMNIMKGIGSVASIKLGGGGGTG